MADPDMHDFWKLHRAGQIADQVWLQAASNARLDITPRQALVLDAIASLSAEKKPSQTALVGATGIDRSTLADLVRRLERKKLLTRRRTRRDMRAYEVMLTGDGTRLLSALKGMLKPARSVLATQVRGIDRLAIMETEAV